MDTGIRKAAQGKRPAPAGHVFNRFFFHSERRNFSLYRLPKEIRDKCRQDPTVPRNVLVEIAQKKQERGMLTQFQKYQDQQAKITAKETADAAVPTQRKRTRAEAITNTIGITAAKIGDLEFPDFSKEDRTMIIDAMNSMKETLDEAIPRAVKNKKKPT